MTYTVAVKESEIQKACLDYLRYKRIFCFKASSTGIYDPTRGIFRKGTSPGCPDIIAIIRGQFVGIEVKTPKGKLSDVQKSFHENIIESGGIVMVVHSVEELESDLQELGY